MDNQNQHPTNTQLKTWLKSDVYLNNIHFWERAWNMVKVPYTQMPDLPYLSQITEGLKQAGTKTVLDLGCGSGWLSIYLARSGFVVTGIDIAAHALELGRVWAASESLAVSFDTVDLVELPYQNSSFDAVVANSIFEHLTRDLAAQTIERLRSIVVPGGTFVGCFDKVGGGPGEYYQLTDGTHVYTDKGRKGMLLRHFDDQELNQFFANWQIRSFETLDSGSRVIWASP